MPSRTLHQSVPSRPLFDCEKPSSRAVSAARSWLQSSHRHVNSRHKADGKAAAADQIGAVLQRCEPSLPSASKGFGWRSVQRRRNGLRPIAVGAAAFCFAPSQRFSLFWSAGARALISQLHLLSHAASVASLASTRSQHVPSPPPSRPPAISSTGSTAGQEREQYHSPDAVDHPSSHLPKHHSSNTPFFALRQVPSGPPHSLTFPISRLSA